MILANIAFKYPIFIQIMQEKEIYILRHGETDMNKRNMVQGRGVNSTLNDYGHLQAKAFFEAYRHIPFEIAYSSSLTRTIQTIQPFIQLGIEHRAIADIDEMDWGIQEGIVPTEASTLEFTRILEAWRNGNFDMRIERGETPLEVQTRLSRFVKDLLDSPFQKILVCTHGRSMRILLCTMLGKELSEMDAFPHQNTCLYKLTWKNGQFEILTSCNTDHLCDIFN